MTLNIDFTPQETAWLNAQAKQQGVPPAEIIRQLVEERLPGRKGTQSVPTQAKPVLSAKSAAALAYLDARITEGENATPEEVRQATEEFEELKRNLNANRTGERDPERVALVRSIRGKYAHTAKVLGTEELHRERQRDKAREEAKIQGYRP